MLVPKRWFRTTHCLSLSTISNTLSIICFKIPWGWHTLIYRWQLPYWTDFRGFFSLSNSRASSCKAGHWSQCLPFLDLSIKHSMSWSVPLWSKVWARERTILTHETWIRFDRCGLPANQDSFQMVLFITSQIFQYVCCGFISSVKFW